MTMVRLKPYTIILITLLCVATLRSAKAGCQYSGGYPWQQNGCLTSGDLNAAIAAAMVPPLTLAPGAAAANLGNAGGQISGPWSNLQIVVPLPSGAIPKPATSALGGVKSKAAASGSYLTGIDINGNPTVQKVTASSNAKLSAIRTTDAAIVIRTGFAAAGDSPDLKFVASGSACTLNSGAGDGGSQVPSSDSKCWLAVFPSDGVDIRWFGADPTGVADSRAAVNAAFALGSNHTFIFSPGTYTIKSQAASPYPSVAGPVGMIMAGTAGDHFSNVKIKGHNAVIAADNSNNKINWFALDFIDHLEVDGLTFQANKTGYTAGMFPSAMIAWHLSDFSIRNIRLSGDWGGSTYNLNFLRGDWLVRGEISDIKLPAIGQCFDLAFIHSVTISNVHAVGAGDAGGAASFPCVSIAYDNAMQSFYPAAAPYNFATTRDVTIGTGNGVSNFEQGVWLRAGQRYQITGNSLHDNPGYATGPRPQGTGISLTYETAACCSSATDPVNQVSIAGNNISDNGSVVTGAGILIDTTLSAGVATGNINISGNSIFNNTDAGISAVTSANLTNVATGANSFAGLAQTTLISPNVPKAGTPPPVWVPTDASGAGLVFSDVQARYNLNDTLVTVYFSLVYPTTADGSNAIIQGLPYTSANAFYGTTPTLCFSASLGAAVEGRTLQNADTMAFYNATTGANLTNLDLSGQTIQCNLTYPAL